MIYMNPDNTVLNKVGDIDARGMVYLSWGKETVIGLQLISFEYCCRDLAMNWRT